MPVPPNSAIRPTTNPQRGLPPLRPSPRSRSVCSQPCRVRRTIFRVVPSAKPGTDMADIDGSWQSNRARVGLHDVRIHDMRHRFA